MTNPKRHLLAVSVFLLVVMPTLYVWLAKENGGSAWAAACSGLLFASIVVFCMAGGKGWRVNPPRIDRIDNPCPTCKGWGVIWIKPGIPNESKICATCVGTGVNPNNR